MRGALRTWLAGVLSGTLLSLSGCGGGTPVPDITPPISVNSGSSSPPSIFQQDTVRIGVKNNQPGTSMQTPTHGWIGFDVLLGEQLVRRLGKPGIDPPRFGDVTSGEREAVLTSGGEDLVIASYSITPKRTDVVYFAGPYATTYQGFLVHAGDAWLNSLDDLKGRTVCSWGGTTSQDELVLQSQVKGYTVMSKTDAESCRVELEEHRADAVSTDQLILYGLANAFPGLAVAPKVTIGVPNVYGVGIKKERYEDCLRIRDFLKGYVFSSDWLQDFRNSLPTAGKPESYLPKPTDIDAMSCKALPHQDQVVQAPTPSETPVPSESATPTESATATPTPTESATPTASAAPNES
ncbi:transporter substrate-binding domain-containing protein [Kitasatospora sp. NPDC093806]|uniref:transporter substrate-binding domain-containing protein n=1 Tax=Kitasatospora sp. NPDC093806 TaxID=3155075 RepID=UPI0034265544